MIEKSLNEFAFYYKRIIRIERYLKDLILTKYTEAYGHNTYKIMYERYFSKIKRNGNINTSFKEVYRTLNKTDEDKLSMSIDKMYISEVLSFFSHRIFLKDKTRKNFFENDVKTNTNSFRQIAKLLKEFRNCVCHFDKKQLMNDKIKFTDALLYFEKLLNCRYKYTSGAILSIEHKLSIKAILRMIYNNNPEYFDDDRVLVNVFDDIAILSGFRTDNLPPYKSIIRAKFNVTSEMSK